MNKLFILPIISIFCLLFLGNIPSNEEVSFIFADYQFSLNKKFFYLCLITIFIISLAIISFVIIIYFKSKYYRVEKKNKKYNNSLDDLTSYISLSAIGNHNDATKFLQNIKKNIPNHPLSNLLELQNKKSLGANIDKPLKKLLNNDATKPFALQALAISNKKQQKYKLAESYLQDLIELSPKSSNNSIALLEIYQLQEKWTQIFELIDKNKKFLKGEIISEYLWLSCLMLAKASIHKNELKKYITIAKKLSPEHSETQIEYSHYLATNKTSLKKYITQIWQKNQNPKLLETLTTSLINKDELIKFLLKLSKIKTSDELIINLTKNSINNDNHKYKIKKLLKQQLEISTDKQLYQSALEFFKANNENASDEEYSEILLQKSDIYSNIKNYSCTECHNRYEEWQYLCNECQNINSIYIK